LSFEAQQKYNNGMKQVKALVHIFKVPFFVFILECLILFIPFLGIKQNRIADGTPYHLFPLTHWSAFLILLIVILTLLITVFSLPRRRYLEALIGAVLLIFPWIHIAYSGAFLLEGLPQAARISPQAGTWMCIAASYILYADALKYIRNKLFMWLIILIPLVLIMSIALSGGLDSFSILKEYYNKSDRFMYEFTTHLFLSGMSVLFACCIGIPLGLIAYKKNILQNGIFFFTNTVQTIPSLALFGLLIAPLSFISYQFPILREFGIKGIGAAPALIALSLYALLPVTLNTFTSFNQIDDSVKESGRGMGMGPYQLFFLVEVPLSLPLLLNGVRIAAVLTIGNTAVAALIRAGGLGSFIFQGLGQSAPDLILLGVIPIIILAITVDRIFALVIYLVSPSSMRIQLEQADKKTA